MACAIWLTVAVRAVTWAVRLLIPEANPEIISNSWAAVAIEESGTGETGRVRRSSTSSSSAGADWDKVTKCSFSGVQKRKQLFSSLATIGARLDGASSPIFAKGETILSIFDVVRMVRSVALHDVYIWATISLWSQFPIYDARFFVHTLYNASKMILLSYSTLFPYERRRPYPRITLVWSRYYATFITT